ncbi:hypothetical protein N7490_000603 [Penicillium lividum]|nr:hypothetical protein N7490_000603 [Penicillium lividum]
MGNTISYDQTPHEVDLGPKGKIRGLQFNTKSRRYAGIPYALPPIGSYRWRKPRPLPATHRYSQPNEQPFDGSTFRPICPQEAFAGGEKDIGPENYSEDCLLLNIWTPVEIPDNPDKKWPVVLWLHGGWFQLGEPLQELGMDPTEMISTGKMNAIVVGIGYRLNIFGFLAGEALLEESDGESAGNFGLWDQRLAMEWVYENIAAFNGDVNNITLGGRSAGAYGVHAQVLREFREDSRRQLFHRFYMYSNAIPAQPKALADVNPQFEELCDYFNVPQDLSAMKHLKNHTFRPVTDNLFIFPGFTEYHKSVLNEETLYATYNSPEPNIDSLRLQLSNYYAPGTTDRILQSYTLPPTADPEDWKKVYGNIIADGQVRAPSRWVVNSLFSHGVSLQDIWRYRIAYRLSFITDKVAPRAFGVSHAMDKPFWNFSILHGPTDEERILMEGWIQSFVAFVNDDPEYEFGTHCIDEMKVATPEGKIKIQKDQRWDELVKLGEVFASGA